MFSEILCLGDVAPIETPAEPGYRSLDLSKRVWGPVTLYCKPGNGGTEVGRLEPVQSKHQIVAPPNELLLADEHAARLLLAIVWTPVVCDALCRLRVHLTTA